VSFQLRNSKQNLSYNCERERELGNDFAAFTKKKNFYDPFELLQRFYLTRTSSFSLEKTGSWASVWVVPVSIYLPSGPDVCMCLKKNKRERKTFPTIGKKKLCWISWVMRKLRRNNTSAGSSSHSHSRGRNRNVTPTVVLAWAKRVSNDLWRGRYVNIWCKVER